MGKNEREWIKPNSLFSIRRKFYRFSVKWVQGDNDILYDDMHIIYKNIKPNPIIDLPKINESVIHLSIAFHVASQRRLKL